MSDPVFIEAMVLGLACVVGSFVVSVAGLIAEVQLRAWLQRRRARRALKGGRRG